MGGVDRKIERLRFLPVDLTSSYHLPGNQTSFDFQTALHKLFQCQIPVNQQCYLLVRNNTFFVLQRE